MLFKRAGREGIAESSVQHIKVCALSFSDPFVRNHYPRCRILEQFNTSWGRDNDGIAADAKLGYQIPRLWFPHPKPGQAGVHLEELAPASAGVAMPEPRPRASGGADLPIGSDGVVQEYQQMQAYQAYR